MTDRHHAQSVVSIMAILTMGAVGVLAIVTLGFVLIGAP